MTNVPDDLRYTADHEYVRRTSEPDVVVVGITDYAQDQLGDVVFVNLPKVGQSFAEHQPFGTIEAVKAVADLYAPVAGEIVALNQGLETDPAAVNRSPYDEGWMIRLRAAAPAALDALLTPAAYRAHIGG